MTEPLSETVDAPSSLDDEPPAIEDRRLELMLVCAHPAIAANIRTPLMLQTVLGVEAAAIAEAFAVEPATMAQRLVRAKKRIRDAGHPVCAARTRRPRRAAAVGAGGRLRRVRDRLAAHRGRFTDRHAVGRGTAPGAGAGRPAARRAGGARPRRAGVPVRVAASAPGVRRTAVSSRSTNRTPARWDTTLIARGEAIAAPRPRVRQARPLPVRGGDPVGALRSRHLRPRRRAKRCSSCTGQCCALRRRWGRRWPRRPWTGRSTGPTRGYGRWTPSPTRPSNDSSLPGRPGRTCWRGRAATPTPRTRTAGPSN